MSGKTNGSRPQQHGEESGPQSSGEGASDDDDDDDDDDSIGSREHQSDFEEH